MTIMVKVDMCYPETTGPYKPVYEPVTRIVIGIFSNQTYQSKVMNYEVIKQGPVVSG